MNQLDISKMAQKLTALNNRGKKKGNNDDVYWKPEQGPDVENVIRIVPLPTGDPFPEYHIHWDVLTNEKGELIKGGVLCPKKHHNENCPFCELGFELYKQDNLDEAKKLWPSSRYRSVILVRGQEDKGLRIWSYPSTVYGKLLTWVTTPRYGDITDLKNGIDIIVKQYKKGDATYATYDLDLDRNNTPILVDKNGKYDAKAVEELMSNIPEYQYKENTAEEIAQIFASFIKARTQGVEEEKPEEKSAVLEQNSELSAKVKQAVKELGGE